MRTPLIAGNWKMFKTVAETVAFVRDARELVKGVAGAEIVVAPPFTAVHAAATAASGANIAIASQDLYWEREGAFTGEISPVMVKEAGATYAIVGHSERRRLFGETDAIVNRKTLAAIAVGLTPIVCIGETLEERERGEMLAVLDRQIKDGLDQLTAEQVGALVVAYEPVWAIGTGRTATAAQAGEAHAHIRKRLRQWFGADAADRCRILYGGSVKPDNIGELIAEADVDGALVGGASLDPRVFADIVTRGARPTV
jgi:triosephosphate isomerase